jgi:vacuolar fusion protein MON1
VNAYISFLRKSDEEAQHVNSSGTENADADAETPTRHDVHPDDGDAGSFVTPECSGQRNLHEQDSGIALVCISGGGEFETIRTWCDTVINVRINM